MWGELFTALLETANQDANNETVRAQSQYQLAIEQERTRQQKETTKREIISGIIGGVFDVLSTCANASTGSDKKTQ